MRLYPNKSKNWNSGDAEILGVIDRNRANSKKKESTSANQASESAYLCKLISSSCWIICSFFLCLILFVFVSCRLQSDEGGNSIIITENGFEMYQWDLDFVREAKESIEISPMFFGGKVARELLKLIETRIQECPNLQIYILTATILIEPEDWRLIEHLKRSYPCNFHMEVAVSIPIIWPDISAIDNHLKMVIVDETYFSTGGTNLDENQATEGTWTPPRSTNKISVVTNNLPAGMRDQDIVGRGSIARELREAFHKHYALWEHYNSSGFFEKDPETFKNKSHYFEVKAETYVERFEKSERRQELKAEQTEVIMSGVYQQSNKITEAYIKLIDKAQEEIVIANLYFCPVEPLLKALMDAVNRGVKITIITNGLSEHSPEYTKLCGWANRIHYVPVIYGSNFHFWDAWNVACKPIKNTRIFEYQVDDVLLHKKTMIVDNQHVVIGCYNFGFRSHMGDYEMIVKINSPEAARAVKKNIDLDLKNSKEISPGEARSWYFDPFIASLGEMQKRFHGLL